MIQIFWITSLFFGDLCRCGSGRSKVIDESEWHLEPCQTSKTEHFATRVNGWKLLTIFAKSSILDVWQGSEYASPWVLFFIIMMYAVLYAFWSEKLWKLLVFFLNQKYNNKKNYLTLIIKTKTYYL